MKRAWVIFVCVLAFSTWGLAEEHGAAPKTAEHAAEAGGEHGAAAAEGHDPGDPYLAWKWANFAILAVVLGYMLSKALPPFFASRTAEIQKGIADASKMRSEAEQRAADMERRMASLSVEIDQIRTEARTQMAKEGERIQKDAEQQLARIQHQAEQEVGAISKHASLQLKAEAARLALDIAEQRLRGRMDSNTQGVLVERFVKQMGEQGVRS